MPPFAPYAELLPLLDSPRKEGDTVYSFCPTHGDGSKHNRSAAGRGGRSLMLHPEKGLKCNSGCPMPKIIDALKGRQSNAASAPARSASREPRQRLGPPKVAYEYRDPISDALVAVHGRWEWPDETKAKGYDKTLRWRLPDKDYDAGLGGLPIADLPLYHADRILMAEPDRRVWWVEGEEAVRALERAGEIATTGAGGSGGAAFNRDQLAVFADRDVIIWPDNDEAGEKHAQAMLPQLREFARRVAIWRPRGMPPKGDAVEFFGAKRSLDEFAWPAVDSLGAYEVSPERAVEAARTVGLYQVTFRAVDVRREATGVHAVVSLSTRGGLLASSNFNVERDAERVTLSNSAYGQLSETLAAAYPKKALKADLDRFCTGLWDAIQGEIDIDFVAGDPDIPTAVLTLAPYIVQGGGTILFAPPGSGKSNVAMLMAASLQHAVYNLWEVEPQPVLYLNLERSKESMQARIARVNEALGVSPTARVHMLNARGRTLFDVASAVRQYCRRHGIRVGILDSISRAGLGDMNDNRAGNRVIDVLNGLFPTWLALGHTSRDDATHVFGSQMQDAGADLCVQLASQRANGRLGVRLKVTKANDTRFPPDQLWSLGFDEGGLIDIRPAHDGEFSELEDDMAEDAPTHERIAVALRSGALEVKEIANRTGIGYEAVQKALRRFPERFVILGKVPGSNAARWGLAALPSSNDDKEPAEQWWDK